MMTFRSGDEKYRPYFRRLAWVIPLVVFFLLLFYALLHPDRAFGDGGTWLTEQTREDAYWLARCVEGEGAHLFGSQRDEVADWIAHTFVNRSQNAWHKHRGIKLDVILNCHGYTKVEEPHWWAYEASVEALIRLEDVTGGALFFLSGDDLERMGLEGTETLGSFRQGRWSLHFFEGWPVVIASN